MFIFTYWCGDIRKLNLFLDDWMSAEISVTILNDDLVKNIIRNKFPDFIQIYEKITIPSCKSDIARLILLYQYGGMYIDAHVGPHNIVELNHLMNLTNEFELIVFTNKIKDKYHLLNGALICRKESKLIFNFLKKVFLNMKKLFYAEMCSEETVPYNLSVLTGQWIIRTQIFELSSENFLLIPSLVDKVFVKDLSRSNKDTYPIHFYRHYTYREKGLHWSELQKNQKLFIK